MNKHLQTNSESGVALLTTLLIVLVLSAISVAALDGMRRNVRLEANASSVAQAQWFALGADAYVKALAEDLHTSPIDTETLEAGARALTFPLDHGYMEIRIADGSTCLNLNSVVAGANNTFQRHETGASQFQALLIALGYSDLQARELTEALIGWIDTGNGRNGPDRDDSPYLALSPGYMTGREPLAEVSELRAIRGFTPEIYETIRPYVCVHPTVGPSRINLNALTPDDAPLLVALFEGRLKIDAARRLLANRPEYGWTDLATFWSRPEILGIGAADSAIEQTELHPTYLDLTVYVSHLDAEATLSGLLVYQAGNFITASRRWSEDT